jgi:hypothetical protein
LENSIGNGNGKWRWKTALEKVLENGVRKLPRKTASENGIGKQRWKCDN